MSVCFARQLSLAYLPWRAPRVPSRMQELPSPSRPSIDICQELWLARFHSSTWTTRQTCRLIRQSHTSWFDKRATRQQGKRPMANCRGLDQDLIKLRNKLVLRWLSRLGTSHIRSVPLPTPRQRSTCNVLVLSSASYPRARLAEVCAAVQGRWLG